MQEPDLSETAEFRVSSLSDQVDMSYETRVLHDTYGTLKDTANEGTFRNFMKDMTTINADGTAKLPMGPEIYHSLRTSGTARGEPESLCDFLKDAAQGHNSQMFKDYANSFDPDVLKNLGGKETFFDNIGAHAKNALNAGTPEEFGSELDEISKLLGQGNDIEKIPPWSIDSQLDPDLLTGAQRL